MMMDDKPRVGDDEAEDGVGMPDDAEIETKAGTQAPGAVTRAAPPRAAGTRASAARDGSTAVARSIRCRNAPTIRAFRRCSR